MKTAITALALCLAMPAFAQADAQRQAEVVRRGLEVMPFSQAATMHVFTRTADGGVQRVVAKDPADATQVRLVREHLRELSQRFERGDFAGPQQIHGAGMPGLARLKAVRAGELSVEYREVEGGAELVYRSAVPDVVQALHQWFGAQLADHGAHAMEGHAHH